MSFCAYMLRCSDGSYYVGHTDDLERRMAQHEAGEMPGYTHDRRPVALVWSESFGTREEALAAEMRVKGWTRAKKESLIRGDWNKISDLAIPPAERDARALRLRSGRTDVEPMETTSVRAERSRSTATALTACGNIVSVDSASRSERG